MAIKNSSRDSEVRRAVRMCCCPIQEHITQEDVQNIIHNSDYQLRNLPRTFEIEIEGKAPYEIREMFWESKVPFRWQGCIRNDMLCCGCCTRLCKNRCPQDVMCRAYLICGNILDAPEEFRSQRYSEADLPAQMLYDELMSETPRYFAIVAMINEYGSPLYNKQLERVILTEYAGVDSPSKYDYAPQFEYEETSNGLRKKVDPDSGEVYILDWPRSGMCPFCLPSGMIDRRRICGTRNYKKGV